MREVIEALDKLFLDNLFHRSARERSRRIGYARHYMRSAMLAEKPLTSVPYCVRLALEAM